MDFSYVHIKYFIGYVYHICLQDTIQSTLSLCLRCQAMLLPMPLRPLLLTTRSGFMAKISLFEKAARRIDGSVKQQRRTVRAQVCLVFVGVHRSIMCIYDIYT